MKITLLAVLVALAAGPAAIVPAPAEAASPAIKGDSGRTYWRDESGATMAGTSGGKSSAGIMRCGESVATCGNARSSRIAIGAMDAASSSGSGIATDHSGPEGSDSREWKSARRFL